MYFYMYLDVFVNHCLIIPLNEKKTQKRLVDVYNKPN